MNALIRRNLNYLTWKNTSSLGKSHASPTLFLYFSTKTQLVDNPTAYDFLLHKHHFSPEIASKVALILPRITNPENADSILSFLKEIGFSKTQLEKVVKYRPGSTLSASLEDNIKPKIRIFQDLGLSSDDIAKIISSNLTIFHVNVNTRVIPALSMLKGLLGSNDAVAKLLRRSSWCLTKDLKNTMVPNIEFLKSYGLTMERIFRLLYNRPRCFLRSPEIMRRYVEKAEEMGGDPSSNMFIYSIGAVTSMNDECWELKLEAFRNIGFSDGDIKMMFKKAPQAFTRSGDIIKETIEVLLATGKYDLSCIANNPLLLSSSLERRSKPRLLVLEMLEARNLIKNWPHIRSIYAISDKKFLEKFVYPYRNVIGEEFCRGQKVEETAIMLKQLGLKTTGMKY